MTARANIHIDKQELVGTRTVRIKFATDLLFAAGDVLELEISEVTGPYVISAVREMNEDNWPKRWWSGAGTSLPACLLMVQCFAYSTGVAQGASEATPSMDSPAPSVLAILTPFRTNHDPSLSTMVYPDRRHQPVYSQVLELHPEPGPRRRAVRYVGRYVSGGRGRIGGLSDRE